MPGATPRGSRGSRGWRRPSRGRPETPGGPAPQNRAHTGLQRGCRTRWHKQQRGAPALPPQEKGAEGSDPSGPPALSHGPPGRPGPRSAQGTLLPPASAFVTPSPGSPSPGPRVSPPWPLPSRASCRSPATCSHVGLLSGGVRPVPSCVPVGPPPRGAPGGAFLLSRGRGGGPESEKGMEAGVWGASSKDGCCGTPWDPAGGEAVRTWGPGSCHVDTPHSLPARPGNELPLLLCWAAAQEASRPAGGRAGRPPELLLGAPFPRGWAGNPRFFFSPPNPHLSRSPTPILPTPGP